MPISDPRDRFFHPHHTHMKDTYILSSQHTLLYQRVVYSILPYLFPEGIGRSDCLCKVQCIRMGTELWIRTMLYINMSICNICNQSLTLPYPRVGKKNLGNSVQSQISSKTTRGKKRIAQKDTIKDITRDSLVNSHFPHRW